MKSAGNPSAGFAMVEPVAVMVGLGILAAIARAQSRFGGGSIIQWSPSWPRLQSWLVISG